MSPLTLAVRSATPDDATALTAFAASTFRAAFAWGNAADNLEAYIAATYSEAIQLAEIVDSNRITLIAEVVPGTMAGFAQLRHAVPPPCVLGDQTIELQRFYISPEWHGQGLARQLMDAVVEVAEGAAARTLWLAVWERNPRAIAFYSKCGYVDVGEQPFQMGTDRQSDRVMMREI